MDNTPDTPTEAACRARGIGWYPIITHGIFADPPGREEHLTPDVVEDHAEEFSALMRIAFPRIFNPFDPCFHESLGSVRRVADALNFYADAMETYAFDQQDELRELAGIVDRAIREED